MAVYINQQRVNLKSSEENTEGQQEFSFSEEKLIDVTPVEDQEVKQRLQPVHSAQPAYSTQSSYSNTAQPASSARASQADTAENLPAAPENSKLDLLKSKKFDIRNFHKEFSDNSEAVLYELLNMQSNDAPLKKGGDGIAYRADAIIMNNRQAFTIPENNLFDLISGAISSRPDDTAYIITGKEASQKLGLVHGDNAYIQLKNATKTLATKPLLFDITMPNGKKRTLNVSWYEVLTYFDRDMTEDDEESYVSFQPTKFFKALMISSTISHGAHYNIKVSSQIHSRYSRSLYYFLESRKNYMASPNATQGEIVLTLEELRTLLGYPDTYKAGDIKRKILDPALEMNNIEGIDFYFEYAPIKKGKRVTGIRFMIHKEYMLSQKNNGTAKAVEDTLQPVYEMLKGAGFTGADADHIAAAYQKNNRDITYLMRAILRYSAAGNIQNPVGFMISLLNGSQAAAEKPAAYNRTGQKKNSFNDYHQRTYDEDELERSLLE